MTLVKVANDHTTTTAQHSTAQHSTAHHITKSTNSTTPRLCFRRQVQIHMDQVFLHGPNNSPINEWTKAHARWHSGQVMAVRAEEEPTARVIIVIIDKRKMDLTREKDRKKEEVSTVKETKKERETELLCVVVVVVHSVVSQVSELHRCSVCTRPNNTCSRRLPQQNTVRSVTSQGAILPAVSTRGQSRPLALEQCGYEEHARPQTK